MREIKGGKEDRQYAANLRKRIKRGVELSAEDKEWLAAWDERIASMPKGRPPKVQQSAEETPAEGGAGEKAHSESIPTPAPPADTTPPPPLETPPPIAAAPTPARETEGGPWQAKYKKSALAVDDGREMLCLQISNGVLGALESMCDDLRKAKIDPWLDSMGITVKQLLPIYVLGFDQILPAKARMTPQIAMMATSATVIVQRYWHHKAVTEALKHDPETVEWKRKQAERERNEAEAARAHQAEVARGKSEQPQYAAPPPEPERPAPTIVNPVNGVNAFKPSETAEVAKDDPDSLIV